MCVCVYVYIYIIYIYISYFDMRDVRGPKSPEVGALCIRGGEAPGAAGSGTVLVERREFCDRHLTRSTTSSFQEGTVSSLCNLPIMVNR